MGWSRPSGPPRVWRDIEVKNSVGKEFKFTIQDIPEDRYTEAAEYMCTSFVDEEVTLLSMNSSEDPKTIAVMRYFWDLILKQGISIAIFEPHLNDRKPKLVGMNVLMIVDDEFNKKLRSYDITYPKMKKYFDFLFGVFSEGDPRPIFGVDLYLGAFGLSVHPQYRGLELGKRLLEMREDIGRVYNLKVTANIFTSARVQKIAAAVGFKDLLVRDYDDVVDEDGERYFPSLTGKQMKIMMKELL